MRKATYLIRDDDWRYVQFQSPPSVRKATDTQDFRLNSFQISIPAFREEGDPNQSYRTKEVQ